MVVLLFPRAPGARKPATHTTNGAAEAEITPASTPRTQDRTYTDDEMLRYKFKQFQLSIIGISAVALKVPIVIALLL